MNQISIYVNDSDVKYIFATKEELNEFCNTLSRGGKVYNFWREVLQNLPEKLLKEIRTKSTKLMEIVENDVHLVNTKTYRFVTRSGSDELKNNLYEYVVFVDDEKK